MLTMNTEANNINNNNQFFMENGSNFLPNMENCHYFTNENAHKNNIDNATSHSNATNNNPMLLNLNANNGSAENYEPSNNANGNSRHANGTNSIGDTENTNNTNSNNNNNNSNNNINNNKRWNENMLSVQSQQLSNGATSMSGTINGRIPTTSVTSLPTQSQALWNAFHNSRNPWHFNGIPNCYQRLYNTNPVPIPTVNTTSSTTAQNQYPYYHHHSLHHLEHIDPRAMPVYAQNQQGS